MKHSKRAKSITTGIFYQQLSNPYSVSSAEPNFIGLVVSHNFSFQDGQSGAAVYTTRNGITYGEGIVTGTYFDKPSVLFINQWLYNHLTNLT